MTNLWEKTAGLWERAKEKEPLHWMVWGFLFLLTTFAFVNYPKIRFGALSLVLLGLYLSARFRMKGCFYSLLFLSLSSVVHHALIREGHFWTLGLEISMGLAFFITALASEEIESKRVSEEEKKKIAEISLQNLEQELEAVRQTAALERIEAEEKRQALVSQLEEVQKELSSLLILNDVLRKEAARRLHEAKELRHTAVCLEREKGEILEEKNALALEKKRLLAEEGLVRQVAERLEEANRLRVEKYQMQLINEDLAGRYAKACWQKKAEEKALQERRGASQAREEIESLREAVSRLTRTEDLYLQLRQQFEEKNEILHKTRQELFAAQTALEAEALEKTQEDPVFWKAERDWHALEEENQQLQQLITFLNGQVALTEKQKPIRKKKSKADALEEAQAPLF